MNSPQDIPRTSIADRRTPPGELTLRFTRWHQVGHTAYQKGQFAGFTVAEARPIIACGAAVLAGALPQKSGSMITK